jgi:hypothetical protein
MAENQKHKQALEVHGRNHAEIDRGDGVCMVAQECPPGVCTENLVRVDLMRESLNVGHDGRADISLREPGCLALQVQEPT